jgi:hypothetical protein
MCAHTCNLQISIITVIFHHNKAIEIESKNAKNQSEEALNVHSPIENLEKLVCRLPLKSFTHIDMSLNKHVLMALNLWHFDTANVGLIYCIGPIIERAIEQIRKGFIINKLPFEAALNLSEYLGRCNFIVSREIFVIY